MEKIGLNPLENQPGVEYNQRHTFGNPLLYLRLGDEAGDVEAAHQEIVETLKLAFDPNNPDSVIPQLTSLNLSPNIHTNLDFINYGNDSIVYLASITDGQKVEKLATLVNQPRREPGTARKEYENLLRLTEIDPRFVVRPLAYFQHKNQELYLTPYIENARCIYGGYGQWGMLDPKPSYHFVPFSPEVMETVTSSMIALLVHYYDQERGRGLARTQLSGDDFILEQGWEMNDSASVLENMKLIAARDTIDLPFDQYLDLIRKEFREGTRYSDDSTINRKSEIPIPPPVIEKGIELGQKI